MMVISIINPMPLFQSLFSLSFFPKRFLRLVRLKTFQPQKPQILHDFSKIVEIGNNDSF